MSDASGPMQANARVRLCDDPGRQGVLTGRRRERRGLPYWQVRFSDGVESYIPVDQIELVTEESQDPLDLLESGRLGRQVDLRRILTHVRLTGRLANIIYSMDTTGTDFYAYQFKPVLKLLNSTSSGILIADEVGLGKTIEAGLIWTELRSRFDFRRLLVLCPAVLCEKWKLELRRRFGVDAEVLPATDLQRRLRDACDQGSMASFAIVSSMQGLRPHRGWDDPDSQGTGAPGSRLAQLLRDQQAEEPLVDVLVIDEAHYLRNSETMTSAIGRLLRGVAQYVVLLSATPVHLRSQDLFQLVNLIDRDTFDHPQAFDSILAANEPLVRAREEVASGRAKVESVRAELLKAQRQPLLAGSRQLQSLLSEQFTDEDLADPRYASHLAYRLETVNLLGQVVTRTRKRDVKEWRVLRDVVPEEVPLSPIERAFYDRVTGVVREYCERAGAHEGFLLVTPQRQMSSSMPAALRYWQSRALPSVDEVFEDLGTGDASGDPFREDPGPLVHALVSRVGDLGDYEALAASDSKYARLRKQLKELFRDQPEEKVVLFSYFRATLDYLAERLGDDGIGTVLMKGGMEGKEGIIEEFRSRPGSTVLLSSEVGSEGIDLQFARVVVNYDLPWNPMRVEQRIGRIDRLGQKAARVVVWNLFSGDTIDARIYRRLFVRLKIFERALGTLEPVLGDRIQDLTLDLLRNHLTPEEEERRIEQTARALENIRRHEEDLEDQATHLVAYGDYILNQVMAARELSRRIEGGDIQTHVLDFFRLRYPGCEFRQSAEDSTSFEISLSNEAKHAFEGFLRAQRLEGTTRLTRNDVRYIACRFENSAVPSRGGKVETISQFHPLVRFVSQAIGELHDYRHPAVAIRLPRSVPAVPVAAGEYVFAVQRWSIRGLQEVERLFYSGALLSDPRVPLDPDQAERLVGAAATFGEDWGAAADEIDLRQAAAAANDPCLAEADEAFDRFVAETRAQNEDRADIQERTLEKHFENQRRSLEDVRERHRRFGRAALVSATEGRIRALTNRVERRRLEIAERRRLIAGKDEICIGVIRVGVD